MTQFQASSPEQPAYGVQQALQQGKVAQTGSWPGDSVSAQLIRMLR